MHIQAPHGGSPLHDTAPIRNPMQRLFQVFRFLCVGLYYWLVHPLHFLHSLKVHSGWLYVHLGCYRYCTYKRGGGGALMESTKWSQDGSRTQDHLGYAIMVFGRVDDPCTVLDIVPNLSLLFCYHSSLIFLHSHRCLHNIHLIIMEGPRAFLHRSVDLSSPKRPFHTIRTSFSPHLLILDPAHHPFHLFRLPIPSPSCPP